MYVCMSGQTTRAQELAWATWRNHVFTKTISWAQWHTPIVVPATWEAEVGEAPEPRRLRLQ